MSTPNAKGAQPCGGCPWRRENQTAEAVAASPQDGGWFDPANLRAHWKRVADGSMLPCHETDPLAPVYGGEACSGKHQQLCVGVSAVVYREITCFMQAGGDFASYRAVKPGARMTLLGLASWASRLLYHGAHLDVAGRSLEIPHVTGEYPMVRVPWKDPLNPIAGGKE